MKIYKYPVNPTFSSGECVLELPCQSKFIHAGLDSQGQLCVWCLVSPEHPTEELKIKIYGTGENVDMNYRHIKSFVDGDYVWHVFYEPNALDRITEMFRGAF